MSDDLPTDEDDLRSGTDPTTQTVLDAVEVISASALAVEKLTAEALVNDNKIFRRRNRLLITALVILILLTCFQIYRQIYVTGPRAENTAQTVEEIQEANEGIELLLNFINESQANNPEAAELQERVFEAALEIRYLICVTQDPALAAACAELDKESTP